jgi:hypothetical protein
MLHEGETPPSITFTEPVLKDGKSFSLLKLNDPFGLPEFWLWNMAKMVAQAPENRGQFSDYGINNPGKIPATS